MPLKEENKMSATTVVLQGTVKPDGTLELEGKVPLPPGKVSVTLQSVPYSQETDPLFVLLRGIWAGREAAGIQPRTREEVDADLEAVRDEVEEHVEMIGKLQEEGRRGREEAQKREAAP
jgi:hypothetical protein